MHEERKTRQKAPQSRLEGPVPRYILDREEQTRAKVLSNTIKQKRKENAVLSHELIAHFNSNLVYCVHNIILTNCYLTNFFYFFDTPQNSLFRKSKKKQNIVYAFYRLLPSK